MSSKRAKKKDDELEKTKTYKVKGKRKKKEKEPKPDLKSMTKKERKAYKKQKRKKSKIRKFFLVLFLLFFLAIVIGLGIFAGMFFGDTWTIDETYLTINTANSIVYDGEGNVICELNGNENRKIVSMAEMSPYLPKAFIAIEDKRFYDHDGIDIKRTAAAVVSFVTNKGSSSFGGSSITQQLIKNITDEEADTGFAGVERKVKEMSRAYKLEKILTKEQILEKYLNLIYMGGGSKNISGAEVAAEYYFNKKAIDLDIAECAFLAGINHSPNAYNPYSETDNSEKIKTRTKTVLYEMKDQGMIDETQYQEACAKVDEGLKFEQGNLTATTELSFVASAAIDQIAKQIAEEQELDYDYARDMLYGSGYRIYTTEVPSIQNRLEEEYLKEKYIKASKENEGAHTQSAMVIIDHEKGHVVGCAGGLGEDSSDALGLNRALQPRQPGSAVKPIAAIAPAVEAGIITAATVYDDSPTSFPKYSPRNSTGYQGLCTVRRAIGVSANIFEVKVLSDLGIGNSIAFLQKAGVTTVTEEHDSNLAMVLGGMYQGISPLEMAGVYAMIANDGLYIEPTFYTELRNSDGILILEPDQEKTRVMSEGNAYILQSILTEPVVGAGGTATGCKISGMSVAAKTGSTTNNVDRWLCGFTPHYTAATWFGYDLNERVVYSGNPSAHIWTAVMRDIHKGEENATFDKPSNIKSAKICMDSGCRATESCSRTYTEVFVEGTVPGSCEGHKKLTICTETGKIATEACKATEEKTYVTKPEKEQNAGKKWTTKDDGKYEVPEENCDVHKLEEEVNKIVNNTISSNTATNNTTSSNTAGNTNTINGGGNAESTTVVVPRVTGKTIDEAGRELVRAGLEVLKIIEEENSAPEGTVIKQGIEPGVKVDKGTKISLTISKGQTEKPATNTTTTTPTTNTTTE